MQQKGSIVGPKYEGYVMVRAINTVVSIFLALVVVSGFTLLFTTRPTDTIVYTINNESIKQRILWWPKLVKAVQQAGPLSNDPFSLEYLYLKDCWNDNDWLRMVFILFIFIFFWIFVAQFFSVFRYLLYIFVDESLDSFNNGIN